MANVKVMLMQPLTEPTAHDFAHFYEHSLDLMCIVDSNGYFKHVNPAWENTFGWAPEVLTAAPFLNFVHPADHVSTQREFNKLVIMGANARMFQNRYRHQNGSYLWLQWNAKPIPEQELVYAMARNITKQKWLEREIIEISDREKERIGRELHDGLCQTLFGIAALSMTLTKQMLTMSPSAASKMATEIYQLLNEANDEARDIAHCLSSSIVKVSGLDKALNSLAIVAQRQHRVRISCNVSCAAECDGNFFACFNENGTHIYRIAQEALNNAIKHGRAKQIEINLCCNKSEGLLSVCDNGTGISGETYDNFGTGIHTMTWRACVIGGSLEVLKNVSTHKRTVINCSFPLPCPKHDYNEVGGSRNDI